MSISRRLFLRHVSGATLYLPFLPSLFSGRALAASPKRFIFLHYGHGQFTHHWIPDPKTFTWTNNEALGREVLLSSIKGPINKVLGKEFDGIRDKISLLGRIDYTSMDPNHNAEAVLTGGNLGRKGAENSIDQVISQVLYKKSPFNLTVNSHAAEKPDKHHVSVRDGKYVVGDANPASAFNKLFNLGGATPSPTDTTKPKPQVDNKKLIDLVHSQYKALEKNPRLSAMDKAKLQEHAQLVSELQAKFDKPKGVSSAKICKNPKGPSESPLNSGDSKDYDVVLDQAFAVLSMAIRCNAQEVATLMFHPYDHFNGNLDFLGLSGAFHESVGHGEGHEDEKLKLMQYYGKKVAKLITELEGVDDTTSGESYLDNSIVYWGNDMGASNTPKRHSDVNLPVLLAGSCGSFFKTGRYVDYGKAWIPTQEVLTSYETEDMYGRPINQLLISIMQGMGLKPSDYEKGGNKGFGNYGSKTKIFEANGMKDHRTASLPFITK